VTVAEHTFLFADLAGYTALTEIHGDGFAADAAADFVAEVRQLLPERRAELVKTIGDAVLVKPPDAGSGIRLAIDILQEVGRRHGALAVRIGIHTGTAVARDGDWFGAAVNLASRLAGTARPGEIAMTAVTRREAGEALDGYWLENRGLRGLKNVTQPIELHTLTLAYQPAVAELPVDPVCRMTIEPGRPAEHRTHHGQTYAFCSVDCALIFERHPDRYTNFDDRPLTR